MDVLTFKTLKNMCYNIKSDIKLRTYACFSLSSYRVAILDAILNYSKRSMMPAGHHSVSDSTLLPLPKSLITWFGGIFLTISVETNCLKFIRIGLHIIFFKPAYNCRTVMLQVVRG